MSYAFETTLFGLTVEVEGVFDIGEPESIDSPSIAPSFEIESVKHKGCELEDLPDEVYEELSQAAFDDAHDNYDPY